VRHARQAAAREKWLDRDSRIPRKSPGPVYAGNVSFGPSSPTTIPKYRTFLSLAMECQPEPIGQESLQVDLEPRVPSRYRHDYLLDAFLRIIDSFTKNHETRTGSKIWNARKKRNKSKA
jgi:hypothetical protein